MDLFLISLVLFFFLFLRGGGGHHDHAMTATRKITWFMTQRFTAIFPITTRIYKWVNVQWPLFFIFHDFVCFSLFIYMYSFPSFASCLQGCGFLYRRNVCNQGFGLGLHVWLFLLFFFSLRYLGFGFGVGLVLGLCLAFAKCLSCTMFVLCYCSVPPLSVSPCKLFIVIVRIILNSPLFFHFLWQSLYLQGFLFGIHSSQALPSIKVCSSILQRITSKTYFLYIIRCICE